MCIFLPLFLLSWETDLRKHWYTLCQRIFCLCSLLGVLWCHIWYLSLLMAFGLKSVFVWYEYHYPCFPVISVCMKYIFFYFNLWVSFTLKWVSAAAAAKSHQLCPTLCDPIDGSPPGSSIPGILQARTLEWVGISFSNAWKWKVKVKSLSHVWLFRTHGLQPSRLLHPWEFPGKSTGVGCHCQNPVGNIL